MNQIKIVKATLVVLVVLLAAAVSAQEVETFEFNTETIETDNGTEILEAEGHYVAPTGGYAVINEEITVENDTVEVIFEIESPDEGEAVTQAITEVDFYAEREFDDLENYTVEKNLYLDDEELIGQNVETETSSRSEPVLEPLWDFLFSALGLN